MAQFKEQIITVNNIQLHYLEYFNTDKPVIILLHGLTSNAHIFTGLINAGLSENYHIIIPDLRGRGKSDKPNYQYTFQDHAQDIIGLMNHLKLKKINIGGHSFGGYLSVYIAAKYPERIQKVVLLDAAIHFNPNYINMLQNSLDRLDRTYINKPEYIDAMKQAEYNINWDKDLEQYYEADISEDNQGTITPIPDLTNIYRIITFIANEPWEKYFTQIAHPTLLVNGTGKYALNETFLNESLARDTVSKMKNVEYLKVDGNHQSMLFGNNAKIIVNAINDFIPNETDQNNIPQLKVAIVGATGLVGTQMIQVLEERNFPIDELIPVASEKSKGKTITFKGKEIAVLTPEEAIMKLPDIALFSAGGQTSLKYAPLFAEKGTIVIDNSSAWRMNPDIQLVVPEVNPQVISKNDKIIANPNCSTIQMVVALKPLHDHFKIKRVVVSTYQSVSGSGMKGLNQLTAEEKGIENEKYYPQQIHQNILPHIDEFTENGYTKEELKMINETRKILGDNSIDITATTVRVPVKTGHCESVNIEFRKQINLDKIRKILSEAPGIKVEDNLQVVKYPTPLQVAGNDDVFIGRLRIDYSQPNTINCWIAADNLRKGAATNAVQIAELLIEKKLVGKK